MLNSVSQNYKSVYIFPNQSTYYIEKSNFFDIEYAQFLQYINNSGEIQGTNNQLINYKIDDFIIDIENVAHQVAFKYLNGLFSSETYFYRVDYSNQDHQHDDIIKRKEAVDLLKKIFENQNDDISNGVTFTHIEMFIQQFYSQLIIFEKNQNFQLQNIYQIQQYLQEQNIPYQQSTIEELRNRIIQVILDQSLNSTILREDAVKMNHQKKINKQKKKRFYMLGQYQQKLAQKVKDKYNPQINKLEDKKKPSLFSCILQLINKKKYNQYQQNIKSQIDLLEICKKQEQEQLQSKFEFKYDKLDYKEILKKDPQQENIYQKVCYFMKTFSFSINIFQNYNIQNKMKKYENLQKDIFILKTDSYVAAIQKKENISEKLKQFIEFLDLYENIQVLQNNSMQSYQIEIPNFNDNNQDSLAQTLVDIVCEQPGQFYHLESKENREILNQIHKKFVFSPDNTFKMVQIAYRISAGVPVLFMGETGIGKTQCIKILSELMGYEFRIIEVEAGIHVDTIVNTIQEYQDKLKQNDQKVIIFFDEINTTYCVNGILKEIIIDRHLNGQKINDKIVFIAACNPYQIKKYIIQHNIGMNINTHNLSKNCQLQLTYKVNPLRESFSNYIINIKSLSAEEEQIYVQNLIDLYRYQKFPEYSFPNKIANQLTTLIMQSQLFVRNEACEKSVSLRDVNRFLILLFFFYTNYYKIKDNMKNTQLNKNIDERKQLQKSIILSLYMVYQIRLLDQDKRNLYEEFYSHLMEEEDPKIFRETVEEELKWLIDQCSITTRFIAQNKALKENVFCIVICILNRIPLIITGEPGTSKTLSFSIAINALKGNTQSLFFSKQPTVKEFYYQGNPQTTSKHIQDIFEKAKKYMNGLNENQKVIPVVVIDEIGQGELNKENPNKILHFLLENCEIAFLAISNIAMDVSNMNRCMHLYRQRLTLQDLKDFIEQILKGFNDLSIDFKKQIMDIAQIYDMFQKSIKNYYHGTRDFYYTVKYSCYQLQNIQDLNKKNIEDGFEVLIKSFQKNFGGHNRNQWNIMNKLSQYYKQELIQNPKQNDLIKESLKSINSGEYYFSRFLMLVTDDPFSCMNYVQGQFKEENKKYEVFMGSHFKNDKNVDLSKEVSKINARIESGINIISVQQHYLYTIYYDFFTMNFIKLGDHDTFRISYKSYSTRVQVHRDFIFVIIVRRDDYKHMDPALKNRFEKHIIDEKNLLEEDEYVEQIEEEIKRAKVFTFSSLSGLSSLVKQQKSILKTETNQVDKRVLLEACLNKIGDLTFRSSIIHYSKELQYARLYSDWLSRIYLDNILSYLDYENNLKKDNQEGFKSIIYTTSFMNDDQTLLIKEKGYQPVLINVNRYSTKQLFLDKLDAYFSKNNHDNLLIVIADQNFESLQNLYYIKYELEYQHNDYCQKKIKQKSQKLLQSNLNSLNPNELIIKQKNIVFIIQLDPLNIQGLAFSGNWKQLQIDNLFPYIYTIPLKLPPAILKQAREKLNYRYLSIQNILTILNDDSGEMFQYFTNLPGFSVSLMTSFQINDNIDQSDNQNKFDYLNCRIKYFKTLFSSSLIGDKSGIYSFLFKEFRRKTLALNKYEQDWSKKICIPLIMEKKDCNLQKDGRQNYNLISIVNYEKMLINHIKRFIIKQLSEIIMLMEQKGFIIEESQEVGGLSQEQGQIHLDLIEKYFSDINYNEDQLPKFLQKTPMVLQLVCSQQIYKKLESCKSNQNNVFQLQHFKKIMTEQNFKYYLHDFFLLKNSLSMEFKKIIYLLTNKKKILNYIDLHTFCWNFEEIFTRNIEFLESIGNQNLLYQFELFMKNKQSLTNENLEDIRQFFKNLSFQTIELQSAQINVFQMTQQVNQFLRQYTNESIESQILMYLLKIKEIIPQDNLKIYQEIKNYTVQFKEKGKLYFLENIQIDLNEDQKQLFQIKFHSIHLKIGCIPYENKIKYIEQFLNNSQIYLVNNQNNVTANSIIKQGISDIWHLIIEENKSRLIPALIQEIIQGQNLNNQNYTYYIRQYFQQNYISTNQLISVFFVESLVNELMLQSKENILSQLQFSKIIEIIEQQQLQISLGLIIGIACLKLATEDMVMIIEDVMKTGVISNNINKIKNIEESFTLISNKFQVDKAEENPFQNYLIMNLKQRVNMSLSLFAKQLPSEKWNINQFSFIYQYLDHQQDYDNKLIVSDQFPFSQIFKIPQNRQLLNSQVGQNQFLSKLMSNMEQIYQIQYVYPIIRFVKTITNEYSQVFDKNEVKEKELSFILKKNQSLNEYFENHVKEALSNILKNTEEQSFSSLKLCEFICPQENIFESQVFKKIYDLLKLQNEIVNLNQNLVKKNMFDAQQQDFIYIQYELFSQRELFFFSNNKGEIQYPLLEKYYINDLFINKPSFLTYQNHLFYNFKKEFYDLDLIYYNLKINQSPLSSEQILFLEKQIKDPEICIELREILIKLLQILKLQNEKNIPQDQTLNKLLSLYKINEQLDYKGYQILERFQASYICSFIGYLENQIMDYLVECSSNNNLEQNKDFNKINKIYQFLAQNQIKLEEFKQSIGRFIIRMNKNFNIDQLENNLFINLFNEALMKEFIISKVDSYNSIKQELISLKCKNEDSFFIYQEIKDKQQQLKQQEIQTKIIAEENQKKDQSNQNIRIFNNYQINNGLQQNYKEIEIINQEEEVLNDSDNYLI